jgi:hypothetical protein
MSKIVEMKVFDAGLFESYVKSDVDLGIVNALSVSIWGPQ